ncbi:hypothetical protein RclHR1_01390027 [Rhizophagus clarus]|uniref:Uncharacterized protein n=1 Tax=Rhizophagus clarus TaxID=94130 RepID=A0A2Z6QB83_9GLOM|nr:hypothetical protein RclHR1_01390027 [Rhizophagus clarus]GET04906.1 hypothetical protein GLOIN_2v1556754 [Rhizophagus clarus]
MGSIELQIFYLPEANLRFESLCELTCDTSMDSMDCRWDDNTKIEEKYVENGKELLKILSRSAPTNLREIRFPYDYKFSLEALEEFSEKWKGCALFIFACDPIYKEENYVKLINKYKNNGVIRDFRCEKFAIVVNID